jgi:hypothetical protein
MMSRRTQDKGRTLTVSTELGCFERVHIVVVIGPDIYVYVDKLVLSKGLQWSDALCTTPARHLTGTVQKVTRIAAKRRQNIIRRFMIILGNITCLFYGATGS